MVLTLSVFFFNIYCTVGACGISIGDLCGAMLFSESRFAKGLSVLSTERRLCLEAFFLCSLSVSPLSLPPCPEPIPSLPATAGEGSLGRVMAESAPADPRPFVAQPSPSSLRCRRQDMLAWKRPLWTLSVMSLLLLVAYHDLVRYAIPLALLSNVVYIFGERSSYTTAPWRRTAPCFAVNSSFFFSCIHYDVYPTVVYLYEHVCLFFPLVGCCDELEFLNF